MALRKATITQILSPQGNDFKHTVTQVVEPLVGTDAVTALSDYNSDKTFFANRFGVNGECPDYFTITNNDAQKKITLSREETLTGRTYAQWKTFVEDRYGQSGEFPDYFSYSFDDNNQTITLTKTQTDWEAA